MHNPSVTYEFHHMGIPTTEVHPNERYSPKFKMYTADSEGTSIRIQWHRFEEGCPLHPLIQTKPHPAFKVNDMEKAIAGKNVLLGPYFPLDGFQVAIIEEAGVPIELIRTDLTDEEIWAQAKAGKGSAYQR